MTLRIETASDGETALLRLSGQVDEDHLVQLQAEIRRYRPRLVVDLAEATLVDRAVVLFLAAREGEGDLRGSVEGCDGEYLQVPGRNPRCSGFGYGEQATRVRAVARLNAGARRVSEGRECASGGCLEGLEDAARETFDYAVVGLREIEYFEWTGKKYFEAMNNASLEPRTWDRDDLKRIRFEAIAFMSFLLLTQELEKYLTRRRMLVFGREPDQARIKEFSAAFVKHIETTARALGIWTVQQLPVGSRSGYGITVLERLNEYTRCPDAREAFQRFGVRMGRAMSAKCAR